MAEVRILEQGRRKLMMIPGRAENILASAEGAKRQVVGGMLPQEMLSNYSLWNNNHRQSQWQSISVILNSWYIGIDKCIIMFRKLKLIIMYVDF